MHPRNKAERRRIDKQKKSKKSERDIDYRLAKEQLEQEENLDVLRKLKHDEVYGGQSL